MGQSKIMSNQYYPRVSTECPYKSPSLAKVYAELGKMKDTTPVFNKKRSSYSNSNYSVGGYYTSACFVTDHSHSSGGCTMSSIHLCQC